MAPATKRTALKRVRACGLRNKLNHCQLVLLNSLTAWRNRKHETLAICLVGTFWKWPDLEAVYVVRRSDLELNPRSLPHADRRWIKLVLLGGNLDHLNTLGLRISQCSTWETAQPGGREQSCNYQQTECEQQSSRHRFTRLLTSGFQASQAPFESAWFRSRHIHTWLR
jgi:hypothetical protein